MNIPVYAPAAIQGVERPAIPVETPAEVLLGSKHDDSVMERRDHCPGCASSSLSSLYQESFSSSGIKNYLGRHYEGRASSTADAGAYELVSCNSCMLTFQKYVPADQLLSEIYNAWIPGTDMDRIGRNYSLDSYRNIAEQVQFFIEHFGLPPAELDVLDFGFGWAHWSRMAMGYGCQVWGVELSQERLEHGKSVGIKVVDLENLPSEKFRFINTEQVFEHLTKPGEILAKLAASLAKDGIIKINVPNAKASLKKLAKGSDFGALSADQQMPIAPFEHINSFTYDSLVGLGKTLGLKPMRPRFYQLYNSASGLFQIKNLVRILARPVYRHVFPRSTFVYFVHA